MHLRTRRRPRQHRGPWVVCVLHALMQIHAPTAVSCMGHRQRPRHPSNPEGYGPGGRPGKGNLGNQLLSCFPESARTSTATALNIVIGALRRELKEEQYASVRGIWSVDRAGCPGCAGDQVQVSAAPQRMRGRFLCGIEMLSGLRTSRCRRTSLPTNQRSLAYLKEQRCVTLRC